MSWAFLQNEDINRKHRGRNSWLKCFKAKNNRALCCVSAELSFKLFMIEALQRRAKALYFDAINQQMTQIYFFNACRGCAVCVFVWLCVVNLINSQLLRICAVWWVDVVWCEMPLFVDWIMLEIDLKSLIEAFAVTRRNNENRLQTNVITTTTLLLVQKFSDVVSLLSDPNFTDGMTRDSPAAFKKSVDNNNELKRV